MSTGLSVAFPSAILLLIFCAVNGADYVFGEVQRVSRLHREVTCLIEDRFIPESLIVCAGSSLQRLNLTDRSYSLIAGDAHLRGYGNEDGGEMRFRLISGVLQKNHKIFIVVDHLNHCLRKVREVPLKSATVLDYAGRCEHSGFEDGSPGQARFNHPIDIVKNRNRFYVSDLDNDAVRIIHNDFVTTLTTSVYGPSCLTCGVPSCDKLYVAINSGVAVVESSHTRLLTGAVGQIGDTIGSLAETRYHPTRDMLFLSETDFLVSDRYNNRALLVRMDEDRVTYAFGVPESFSFVKIGEWIYISTRLDGVNRISVTYLP